MNKNISTLRELPSSGSIEKQSHNLIIARTGAGTESFAAWRRDLQIQLRTSQNTLSPEKNKNNNKKPHILH